MRNLVVAGCMALLTTLAVRAADDARAVKLWSGYIGAHAANGDFSGIVRVSRNGKRVYEQSFGLASRPFDVSNRPHTRFLVASVTKTFTAAAIALLEADGKLKLTDSLDKYLPEFPHAAKIKLWHLLGHQAGLQDPPYEAIAARDTPPQELVAAIGAKPFLFEPGTDTRYSNAGYILLARVIEVVSGQPFGAFLQQRIFSRLAMTDSGTLESGEVVPRLADGYIPGIGTALQRPQPRDPSSLYGSGNVYSTAADLDRWLTAIDRATLFDIAKQPYPFGWGKRKWFDKDVLVQSGITNGYSSIILTVPREQLHIVVLMNTQSGFTGDEGKTLLGISEGIAPTLPAKRDTNLNVTAAALRPLAGLYLWGERKVPMHIDAAGGILTLRWADSASVVPLTPLSETTYLDRSSFGQIRFGKDSLVWTQNGQDTTAVRAE